MIDYNIFDPQVSSPLKELTREAAIDHFNLFVESFEIRMEELNKIFSKFNVKMDFSYESICRIDALFDQLVFMNPNIHNELDGITFSICNDLSIYVGEFLHKNCDSVKWIMMKRQKDISYQRPVLGHFPKPMFPNQYLDLDLIFCQYAYRILRNKQIENNEIKKITDFGLRLCGVKAQSLK